ncbi:LysR family transcriptional regulator [Shimia sp.]|uniref:LysR family transcriptional regulator n=1 Tax=Shimia sp. TaxID=1954381 RepID=UPI0032970AF1
MKAALHTRDWTLIQSFLAVAETGSLSGAARKLGVSQPTLGRHIKTLEESLNVELFHRHARGFELTGLGRDMRAHAGQMESAMRSIAMTAAGGETRLKGDVRIATSVFMAHHAMPDIIAMMRSAEPDICIDLVPSDASENLLFREADIAVRMYRPAQLDMVTKHLGDITLGMFATQDYLNRKGRPRSAGDLRHHDMIGYDANDDIIREMRQMGIAASRDWFSVRCDNQSAYWNLVKAGCGLGFCQSNVARATPGIEEVLPDFPMPVLPVWLTAHEAIRHTPRISRIWALLETGLRPFVS